MAQGDAPINNAETEQEEEEEDTDPIPHWGVTVTAEHWPEPALAPALAQLPPHLQPPAHADAPAQAQAPAPASAQAQAQAQAPAPSPQLPRGPFGDDEASEEEDNYPVPAFNQITTEERWLEYQPSPTATPHATPTAGMAPATLPPPPSNPPDLFRHPSEDKPPPACPPSSSHPRPPTKQPGLTLAYSTPHDLRVEWKVPEKKFNGRDMSLASPEFELDGWLFKLILKPFPANVRGGFNGSKGIGKVELKYCGGMELGDRAKVHFRVAAGLKHELSSEDRDHDFAGQPLAILPQEWNFLNVKDSGSVAMHIEVRKEL